MRYYSLQSIQGTYKQLRQLFLTNLTKILKHSLTIIRTVFLRDLIGTYVDNCQHMLLTYRFHVFFNANARCFQIIYIFVLVMDMQD